MNTHLNKIQEILGKPYKDLEFLLECFSEVLNENKETELAAQIPWISESEPVFTNDKLNEQLHMYSICFQLLNLCEVNGAVQNRRHKQEADGLGSVNGLWGNVLKNLKSKGIDEKMILEQFQNVEVEPVLTAHPTEAKRPVVLGLYRQLYLLILKRENSMYNSYERAEVKHDIKRILHKLWFIGEIFIEKPAIESELENALHYFYKVFPEVLPFLDFRLKQAWEESGFDPALVEDTASFPSLTFGNWVGGDRDGHPLVTAEVTDMTLKAFRMHAFRLVIDQLDDLAEKMSIYCHKDQLITEFSSRLDLLQEEAGMAGTNEPFKLFVSLLKAKLPLEERSGGGLFLSENTVFLPELGGVER